LYDAVDSFHFFILETSVNFRTDADETRQAAASQLLMLCRHLPDAHVLAHSIMSNSIKASAAVQRYNSELASFLANSLEQHES
jgi:hypothetical protein